MKVRRAVMEDISLVTRIYDKIHTAEENGEVSIGWKRGIYPVRSTAEAAIERDDLFVMEDHDAVVGTAIINQMQVDVYEKGDWKYSADPTEVMVLHTLIIDPDEKGKGYGRQFVKFYEDHARQAGCKYLRIDTNEINDTARSLYKSMDYEEIGCIPCIFNGLAGVNLVLIEKAL